MKWAMRWYRIGMVAALAAASPAWSQALPPTDPAGTTRQDHVLSYDRAAVPSGIELLPKRTLVGYNTDEGRGYGRIHLTCRSAGDSAKGSCAVSDSGLNGAGYTEIPLRFTERRSGMRTDVVVIGSLQRAYSDRRCFREQWDEADRPLTTSYASVCIDSHATGTGIALSISNAELSRLVAGHWDAELILAVRTDANGAALATYEFGFDLTVTDYDAVSIYLPEFEEATPHLGLNLRYDPIGQSVGGRAVLDMCLYDGLGSQSQYLGLTVRDTGTRPPGATGYSVWHNDGGSDDTQRLDYTITLDHNGAKVPLRNGVEEQLLGIDTARLRLVLLPGMSLPVFCVPTPLTFDTPRVPISSKRPGGYIGDLKLELRVPTASP